MQTLSDTGIRRIASCASICPIITAARSQQSRFWGIVQLFFKCMEVRRSVLRTKSSNRIPEIFGLQSYWAASWVANLELKMSLGLRDLSTLACRKWFSPDWLFFPGMSWRPPGRHSLPCYMPLTEGSLRPRNTQLERGALQKQMPWSPKLDTGGMNNTSGEQTSGILQRFRGDRIMSNGCPFFWCAFFWLAITLRNPYEWLPSDSLSMLVGWRYSNCAPMRVC